MSKSLAALALCVVSGAVAFAQNVRAPTAPGPMIEGQAEMMKLQMAMVAAQQAAIKSGDEALPCETLNKELVSTMTEPAIQAYAARTNAAYAKELAMQKEKRTPMTADTAAALAAALTPGAAMAGIPGLPPVTPGQPMTPQQMQQMQQAMLAQQQAAIASMNQLIPIMPALMRSQRLSMLGVAKNCTWATGGLGVYPGTALSPGAIPPRAPVPR